MSASKERGVTMTFHAPIILRGMWFHSFTIEDGKRAGFEWQGRIVDVIVVGAAHYLLIDLFDWIGGGLSSRRLVPFSRAVDEQWELHDSDAAMRQYYDAKRSTYQYA
jgi:hypothetical protein